MNKIAVCHSVDNISLFGTHGELDSSTIDYETLSQEKLSAVIVTPDFVTEETLEFIKTNKEIIPIYSLNDFPQFLDSSDAQVVNEEFTKMRKRWVFENNIKSIESIFNTYKELRNLWDKDRHQFMNKFFIFINKNSDIKNLSIIFNDLIEKEDTKAQLTHSVVSGDFFPNIEIATNAQKELVKYYESKFAQDFEVQQNSDEIVITMTIDKSPLLLMANSSTFSTVQVAILKSLINGLNLDAKAL